MESAWRLSPRMLQVRALGVLCAAASCSPQCCLFRGWCSLAGAAAARAGKGRLPGRRALWASYLSRHLSAEVSQATLASVAPVFSVVRFDKEGNLSSYERKKTELYQELGLQARDLRFQHQVSIFPRNNRIILRMEFLKAVVTPEYLLILDYRNLSMEKWLFQELAPQLAGEGQLVTYSLPFEFRAIEAILQYWISYLRGRLNNLQPQILETLDALVDPKILSVDRSKVHVLLQNGKSLSELETDLKVFKETILEILDEEELMEELCLTKWTDPRVFAGIAFASEACAAFCSWRAVMEASSSEESLSGIDHAEEMELLLENYYRQAEDLINEARELRVLIDDSERKLFQNEYCIRKTVLNEELKTKNTVMLLPYIPDLFIDSLLLFHRNVMMRLNLQLTMGTFSLSLFGLIGVAFGMNLESSFEEDRRIFWLVTGIMFLGSGLIWRRLLSFLGRHLETSLPPPMPALLKRTQPASGKIDFKSDLKTEPLGSNRSTLTNQ